MAGEIMSLANDQPLLEDDYARGRRRKGKKSSGHRRRQGEKKKSRQTKQSSRIYRAMSATPSAPSTGA